MYIHKRYHTCTIELIKLLCMPFNMLHVNVLVFEYVHCKYSMRKKISVS